MIDIEKRRRILELWRSGHKKKAIAIAVNVSLPTVRKYIREAEAERTFDNKRLNATSPERFFEMQRSEMNPIPIVIRDNSFPPGTRCARAHIHMTAELTDIVHAHLAIPFGLLGSFNPRHTPLVVTCHGSDCTLPYDRPIFRPLVEKTLHRADRVVAVSKYVMDLAIRLGAPPEKVEVIYIGVDTSLFIPPRDRPSLKAAAGLPEDVPVIGVLGRLVPEKRIGDVLRAASRVSRKSDIHVLVGGDGPQRRHLEALASKQGMDNVSFLGAVSDAARFHSFCDVFALASTREGLSYSLQEAMATGCVPVTVDGCGCPEIVSTGDNGYLFKPGNIEDLAEKMLMAVENA